MMSMRPPIAPPVGSAYDRLGEVIGAGAFSKVFKGRHRLTGSSVAIKVFNPDSGNEERFQHTIRCFDRIGQKSNSEAGSNIVSGVNSPMLAASENVSIFEQGSLQSIYSHPVSFRPSREIEKQFSAITKELVVGLLDYSKGIDGKPGRDAVTGDYFLVMELGNCSLEEYIEERERKMGNFTIDEVKSILWDIARVACLLHYHGLAHLDIKPANIMLFNSTYWKLIDFDGCYMAASVVDVLEADVAFTPLYCAPEIAHLIVSQQSEFKVSRLMDVWSIGMIAAELVVLRPFLERQYVKMLKNDDDTQFLKWLANPSISLGLEIVNEFDNELFGLLKDKILVKDAHKRASLPEILQHNLFKTRPINRSTWVGAEDANIKSFISKSVRLLPINPKMYVTYLLNTQLKSLRIHEDSEFPLNHDETAAFMQQLDIEEELEMSNPDITTDLTPKKSYEPGPFMRLICCRSN